MTEPPVPEPVAFDLAPLEFRDVLPMDFPHPLQSVVMPVMAMQDGVVHLRGTAFSIGGNLALTATHVLRRDDDLDDVALLHVVPGPVAGSAHATLLPVKDVTAHEDQTDVAVLRLDLPSHVQLQPLRVGAAPPAKTDRVAIFGYTHEGVLGTVDEVLQLRPKLNVSDGTVVDHYPLGGAVCSYPSFQIDARVDSQMSGGPILATIEGGLMAVRGVVCTGMDVMEGDVPLSFGSMTFTALALTPLVARGGELQPTLLYDLAANGLIPVVDLHLVDFDTSDPDNPRIGLSVST